MGKAPVQPLPPEETIQGTRIRVVRSDYPDEFDMIRALENCNVKARIRFNGEEIRQLRRAREKADLPWCTIMHKKQVEPHQEGTLIVRINGIYQFHQYVSNLPGAAIAEIKGGHRPKDDTYPLTPNRESVRYDRGYKQELDAAIRTLCRHPAALKEDEPFVFERYAFSGRVEKPRLEENRGPDPLSYTDVALDLGPADESHSDATEETEEETSEGAALTAGFAVRPWTIGEDEPAPADSPSTATPSLRRPEAAAGAHAASESRGERIRAREQRERLAAATRTEGLRRLAALEASIIPRLTFRDSAALKLLDAGEHQQPIASHVLVKRERGLRLGINIWSPQNLKLLILWRLIAYRVAELVPSIERRPFHVGWALTRTTLAEYHVHTYNGRSETYLLLNPRGIRVGDKRALTLTLMQRALHELLHTVYSDHDDGFVIALHDSLERYLNPRIREFEAITRSVMGRQRTTRTTAFPL